MGMINGGSVWSPKINVNYIAAENRSELYNTLALCEIMTTMGPAMDNTSASRIFSLIAFWQNTLHALCLQQKWLKGK